MSKISLRERKKQKARTDILMAAERLIERHGYAETKMRDIARDADVSYQTLYNYFPTKASIASALVTANVDHIVADVEHLTEQFEHDLLGTLQRVNRERLEFVASQDRELWREVCFALLNEEDDSSNLYQLIDQAGHHGIHELLTKAQALGLLSKQVDTHTMAHSIFCLSEFAMITYLLRTESDINALVERLSEQLHQLISPYVVPPGAP